MGFNLVFKGLINILYVNKQEFCASSSRSTKVILRCTVSQSSSGAPRWFYYRNISRGTAL